MIADNITNCDMATTGNITIRLLQAVDCAVMYDAFANQGWTKPTAKFEGYLDEQEAGIRTVLVSDFQNEFAGYVTVLWQSSYSAFRERSIPEITDLNVLKKFQRKGIGTRLIEEAEGLISERSDLAGIRVGLTADYVEAHRLYLKLRYLPDGEGISSQGKFLEYGSNATVDDDLTIGFIKHLEFK